MATSICHTRAFIYIARFMQPFVGSPVRYTMNFAWSQLCWNNACRRNQPMCACSCSHKMPFWARGGWLAFKA